MLERIISYGIFPSHQVRGAPGGLQGELDRRQDGQEQLHMEQLQGGVHCRHVQVLPGDIDYS